MTPAAFGVIHAAVAALDADLSEARLAALDEERLTDAWRAASDLCKAVDQLYNKLHAAMADAIIAASHGTRRSDAG